MMPDEPTPPKPTASHSIGGKDLAAAMRADMEAISRTFMPFGKFGPLHFPPDGLPIYDLPAEYLGWFAGKASWPKGKLGRLLQVVYQMKADGSDTAFDGFRRARGGRSVLRPERQKTWTIKGSDSVE